MFSPVRNRIAQFAIAGLIVLLSSTAFAQVQPQFIEYSAKFLCGVSENKAPVGSPVRPGIYNTSINIHNPQLQFAERPPITFVKKVVLSLPEGEKPVPPSHFRRDTLAADFAEQVDCRIIRAMLGPAGGAPFIEGFVVLIVLPSGNVPVPERELDVVGVYTVDPLQGAGISLEIVPIPPRVLAGPAGAAAKLMEEKEQ